ESAFSGVGDAINSVTSHFDLFGSSGDSAAEKAHKAEDAAKSMGDALFGAGRNVGDLSESFQNLDKNLEPFVGSKIEGSSKNAQHAFEDLDVTAASLVATLKQGPQAADDLATALEHAGSKDAAKVVRDLSTEYQAQAKTLEQTAISTGALSEEQAK